MMERLSRLQLPIVGALFAAVLLLALGIGLARYEDQLYAAQQISALDEQARILAASVTAAISFDDARTAQEYVNALKVNPELRAAGVYDAQGKLVARFLRGGPLQNSAPQVGMRLIGDILEVTQPVVEGGRNIGTVSLLAMTEPIQRRIARYAGLILLVTMGALVIGVLSFSQMVLTRRADELANVNEQLHAEMAERIKTEDALRQSHKMEAIGQLSGGIAHDFNNLIMIAKGNLRLLRKRVLQNGQIDAAERYIMASDEALNRAANLTQRILAFSRRQPLSPTPVWLNDLVVGTSDLLRHSVGEKVQIETNLESKWWTLCDVNQMENVILNLANNARDAMPEGGVITIATRDISLATLPRDVSDFVPGDYISLTVQDTGEGMTEDVRQRALDPFFTTKPLGKGTGLGLSMTFGYIRQSQGYLVIESAPGQGTTIVIYMPRHVEKVEI